MRKWIREKLGIDRIDRLAKLTANSLYGVNGQLQKLQNEFDSRRPCRICGKHRYESEAHTRESTHGLY